MPQRGESWDVENVQSAVFVTHGIKPQVTINVGGPLIAAPEGGGWKKKEERIEAPTFFSGSSAFVPGSAYSAISYESRLWADNGPLLSLMILADLLSLRGKKVSIEAIRGARRRG